MEIGFDRCGIAVAGSVAHAAFYRDWLDRGHAGGMSYMQRHVESRIDVRTWLPWARSVIVCALNYYQPPPLVAAGPCRGGSRGKVARYAWGEDYHAVVREKLEALLRDLRGAVGGPVEARVCVDTSAIIERALAAAAGIGWIGKNTMVLHESLGSYFVLGEIVTDLDLRPNEPIPNRCGTCTRCLDACPTQALPQPFVMDARRCISYLTIEHRGEIAPELAAAMGGWVFGCDVCQEVCPYNRHPPPSREPRFQARGDRAEPLLDDVLAWDETAYRLFVDGSACDRARLEDWQRSARIAASRVRRERPLP